MIIAKQGENLKQLGALPRFPDLPTQALDSNKACEERTVGTDSAEENY